MDTDVNGETDHVYEALIVGSGFGGQSAAIELGKAGVHDVVILERRDFVGGTWCQNSYPGAAVDVQSHLYSLSGVRYRWSRLFAEGDELRDYTEHVLDTHGLRSRVRTGENVTVMRWDDEAGLWTVETEAGRTYRARVVVNASGPLSTAVIPPFPGRESFAGAQFHTNDWDHSVDLAGKRVAVVGSGASAAQVIPTIAPGVGHLHVFQRSPHWVMPRRDRVFGRFERWLANTRIVSLLLRALFYWRLEVRVVGFKYSRVMLDLVATRSARRHLRRQVADPALRRALTPDYTIGCKRVILSDTLYPALCRENVTLHTREDGIAEITPEGIVTTTGERLPVDVIVWATGYDATDGAVSHEIVGRDGVRLADVWAEYPRAYLGTTVPGFPNLFLTLGPNTGIGHTSALFIMESQLRYIVDCVRRLRESGARSLEVRADAEERYTTGIHSEMERTVWHSGGCTSWYQSASGKVIAMYPGFSFTYRRHTRRMDPADHVLTPAATTQAV